MPMHDWTKVNANQFHDFHVGLLVAIRTMLNRGILPKGYYARADQTAPPVVPDVLTLYHPDSSPAPRRAKPPADVALATLHPPKVHYSATGQQRLKVKPAERRINIRHNSGQRLIAVIEVVSESNKRTEGIEKFCSKTIELLRDGVHFMFIDCHPPGRKDPKGLHTYIWQRLVHVRNDGPVTTPCLASYVAKGQGQFVSYVEPIAVGQKLSTMPLFLTPEHYVRIPLETAYETAWDGIGDEDRELLE